MKEFFKKMTDYRNLWIKTALAFTGLLLTGAVVYPFIMERFYLTDKNAEWTNEDWILLAVGFFLAVGAAQYNTVLDMITSKFGKSKNI